MARFPVLLSVPIFLIGIAACGQTDPVSVSSDQEEPVAVLDTLQGLDLAALKDLSLRIAANDEYRDMHSLLVMRNGELVFERYYGTSGLADVHTMQSVSKSFTSALIGIALGEGAISSVDEPVLDFFPQWKADYERDPRKMAMTLEDVLTMRTGTDYNENGQSSPHFQLNALSSGWDRFWLDRPMITDPGTSFRYDSGGVIALSAMLKDRKGVHADGYAEEVLFGPLGIENAEWFRNSEGHPHTGGGLRLTSRDMIKLGQLYLQNGVWNGEQVVPEGWVEESLKFRVTFSPPIGTVGKTIGYGYLWWILAGDPAGIGTPIYAAMGYRGQYVFVIPEHDMVVAMTGWMPPTEYGRAIGILYSDILPARVK